MKKNNRIGTFVKKTLSGKAYKAFIPPVLPPNPLVDIKALYPLIEQATQAVGQLNAMAAVIPSTNLFIYMYVRKEALLSSQIEGTQSSLSDLLLFEQKQKPAVAVDDVEEVSNYVAAISHCTTKIKEGFPLCLRLLREAHAILLRGGRGSTKTPGSFRTVQNWIGGTAPHNALFVPPAPEDLQGTLDELERFLHDDSVALPTLIKAGLVHVQFESIHPFLDGNGRLGRLLITLLLYQKGLLHAPILYVSLYLKKNRSLYYRLLQEVRTHGNWEAWLEFFLTGVAQTAQEAITRAQAITKLFTQDAEKMASLGRARELAGLAFEQLKLTPQINIKMLAQALKVSIPASRDALENLRKLGVVVETTGRQRGKVYVYRQYLDLLEN